MKTQKKQLKRNALVTAGAYMTTKVSIATATIVRICKQWAPPDGKKLGIWVLGTGYWVPSLRPPGDLGIWGWEGNTAEILRVRVCSVQCYLCVLLVVFVSSE